MNKTYRVVRNSAGEWVVASELAKGHRKSAGGKALACSSALALLLAMPPVSAADYTVTNANDITKTSAAFEPVIDYVVVKWPRFAFEKFPGADNTLGTQMKSVGEVMSIARTFPEALQKAARSLETGKVGFQSLTDRVDYRVLSQKQDVVRDLTNEAPPANKPRPSLPKAEEAEMGVALRKVIQRPTADRLGPHRPGRV